MRMICENFKWKWKLCMGFRRFRARHFHLTTCNFSQVNTIECTIWTGSVSMRPVFFSSSSSSKRNCIPFSARTIRSHARQTDGAKFDLVAFWFFRLTDQSIWLLSERSGVLRTKNRWISMFVTAFASCRSRSVPYRIYLASLQSRRSFQDLRNDEGMR